VVVLRRATATPRETANPRTVQKDGEARRRNFPRPPGRAGTGRRPRRWRRKCPTKLRGRWYVAHGTSHQDPAKRAAGGDGRQPRRGHRQRARAAAHRQRAENKDGQAPDRQRPRQRQLFRFFQLSNNEAASGTCNRLGIAQFHGTAFPRRNPGLLDDRAVIARNRLQPSSRSLTGKLPLSRSFAPPPSNHRGILSEGAWRCS
jgi:hypothetical protein